MDKKMNNEELQSRREFFKKAAKAALPILAMVAAPAILNAAETAPNGCSRYGCGVCTNGCTHSCKGACETTCKGGCKHYACKGIAKK